jgi:hypothetical protein
MPFSLTGSFRPPIGMMRDQDRENRYAFAPYPLSKATSSAERLYALYHQYLTQRQMSGSQSHATSPEPPSSVFPGVRANSSQIDGPRPSTSSDPSIWNAAVAKPQMKSLDNDPDF